MVLLAFLLVCDHPKSLIMTSLAFILFPVCCVSKPNLDFFLPKSCQNESVHFSYQIPYLGLCACEEQDTGVWQLVDPPILPLTHGPNHSFSWRETLQQEWHSLTCLLTTLEGCASCCFRCTRTDQHFWAWAINLLDINTTFYVYKRNRDSKLMDGFYLNMWYGYLGCRVFSGHW